MRFLSSLLRSMVCVVPLLLCVPVRAVELKITPAAMQRTLETQLFNTPDGRYYLKGDAKTPCFVYVDQPSVRLQDDRVVIHVHTHSRLGAGLMGTCVGIGFNTEADVSVVPDAEGETIGFRDARIDRFTGNKDLDYVLIPFLSRKLPQKLKINAAELLRTALARSRQSSGYELSLDHLKLHSMLVEKDVLTVDMDAALRVN